MCASVTDGFWKFVSLAVMFLAAFGSLRAELKVSSAFEGGSARVTSIDQESNTIHFQPAGNADRGWPCWWCLRVDGADSRRPVILELEAVNVLMPYDQKRMAPAWAIPERAAFSTNETTWTQTALGERRGRFMSYRVNSTSPTFWVAWGPPFKLTDANRFVQNIATSNSFTTAFELCKSREGRSVPALRIAEGGRPADQRPGVWIIARQHAWEVGGSWVARGLIEWLVSADLRAAWIRQNAEVFFVPIMDADRVATGDGGKMSLPQDHNRDWTETPHWPEVAAVEKGILPMLQENRMTLLLDLHNPGAGARRESIYVTSSNLVSAPVAQRQNRFVGLLRQEFPDLEVVDDHPKPNNPADLKTWHTLTTTWLQERANPQTICFAVETPWNTPRGTIEGYRAVGRKLGAVMEKYLRGQERR